jgi:hypothetical protein
MPAPGRRPRDLVFRHFAEVVRRLRSVEAGLRMPGSNPPLTSGIATVRFPGGQQHSQTEAIQHGLDVVPVAVVAASADAGLAVYCRAWAYTSVQFSLAARYDEVLPLQNVQVAWVAVGPPPAGALGAELDYLVRTVDDGDR